MTHAIIKSQGFGFNKGELVKFSQKTTTNREGVSVCMRMFDHQTEILIPNEFLEFIEVDKLPKVDFIMGEEAFFTSMNDNNIRAGSRVRVKYIHIFFNPDMSKFVRYTIEDPSSGIEKMVNSSQLYKPDYLVGKTLISLDALQVITDHDGNQYIITPVVE